MPDFPQADDTGIRARGIAFGWPVRLTGPLDDMAFEGANIWVTDKLLVAGGIRWGEIAGSRWRRKRTMDAQMAKPRAGLCVWPYDLEELRRALAGVENLRKAVGIVNPRPPGWRNDLIQFVKKSVARSLGWYTRPLQEFNASVSRSLTEIFSALEYLSANLVALDERLAHEQLELLHEQVRALVTLENSETIEAPAANPATNVEKPVFGGTRLGNDRTAYVLGLFGTGRLYINELILQNIGERAKYFRDELPLYPGPTSMICSGHVTMKYLSRAQAPPAIMGRILEAVKARFADSIFIYRHPVDSLLTNWVWWRTYIHDKRTICGISEIYERADDLCVDLDQNFFEFKAFAEGDPDFYLGTAGPRFLSFAEFVEETALHFQSATLALRLEDFMINPLQEFSKIVDVMSVNLDLSRLRIPPPRSKPYGYLAVKEKVPRFKNFIDRLHAETKRRIRRVGYDMGD